MDVRTKPKLHLSLQPQCDPKWSIPVEVSYADRPTLNKARAAAGKVARAVLPQRLSMDTLVVVARPGI